MDFEVDKSISPCILIPRSKPNQYGTAKTNKYVKYDRIPLLGQELIFAMTAGTNTATKAVIKKSPKKRKFAVVSSPIIKIIVATGAKPAVRINALVFKEIPAKPSTNVVPRAYVCFINATIFVRGL